MWHIIKKLVKIFIRIIFLAFFYIIYYIFFFIYKIFFRGRIIELTIYLSVHPFTKELVMSNSYVYKNYAEDIFERKLEMKFTTFDTYYISSRLINKYVKNLDFRIKIFKFLGS